ncbi:two-partner secretion domain-containing protein [Methylosinus sp. LW4]|uniref:two-partner secretion domain-containing protein n=1 Tax=Methylosinus sp. LW4 TaxID=136993 RepID=UPI000372BCAC|nr:filamentous hemagglutinin N-terminal domain-containing protein [Methylosinus sp. LW4]
MGALSATTAIAAILALPSFSLANPTGGVVVDGAATISSTTNVTNVVQSTNRAIINWQGFSIGAGETVNFLQPTAMSVTLNRVVGNEQSVISGALNANGKVFLVNSNGILFGKDAQVNVGGLVASTLDISNANFMAGNYIFSGSSAAAVVNKGTINAADGGYVALLGKTVSNEGTIKAKLGTVALASGEQMTLNFEGDSLIDVTIDKGTYNALVENKGLIKANGGQVVLTAKAADDLLSAQVNNSGIIKARTLADLTGGSTSSGGSVKVGKIKLLAQGGSVNVTGKLDASAPKGGDGGMIETSGNKVTIADSATITTAAANGATGSWIIDPDGFTIGLGGDITGAALTTQLATNNVTISSTSGKGGDGNIYVNEAVSWSGNTLTLTATNNIFVDNVMTATGTASFAANYGTGFNADGSPKGLYTLMGVSAGAYTYAGKINFSGTGAVTLNGDAYTVISNAAGFAAVANNLGGRFVLGADVSFGKTLGETSVFTGTFNGFGHLFNSPSLSATGLFGIVGAGATISNLGLSGGSVGGVAAAKSAVGALANVNRGTIVDSFAAMNVANTNVAIAGGLVGDNFGLIAQSYSAGNVFTIGISGGLVGVNEASGKIVDSFTRLNSANTGLIFSQDTTTPTYAGGFVGVNAGEIDRSYTILTLRLNDATSIAGGFVGKNTGVIDQSYVLAPPLSTLYAQGPHVGGFVGENAGSITNSYTNALNTTNASAVWTAGFAYKNSGAISNVYAMEYSANSGSTPLYGFVLDNTGGTISNAYWSATSASGATVPTDSSSAKSLTATQAVTSASYIGFDSSIWAASTSGFPILAQIPVYVATTTAPSYGSATSSATTLSLTTLGLQGGGGTLTTVDSAASTTNNPFTAATSNGFVDAGAWNASSLLSSVYKNVKGVVTIAPKAITISSAVADKVYDGATSATLVSGVANGGLVGLVGNQTLNINYTSAAFADKNAGTGKTVNIAYTLADGASGGKASNYSVAKTTTATIGQKPITATVAGQNKVYDGTTDDTISWALPGTVAGDSLALSYATPQFSDKNAGTGKAVTVAGLTLTGTDAGNYLLQSTTAQTIANIAPLPLTIYGTKSVDGSATINGGNLTAMNLVAGDSASLGGSAKLAGAAAGVQTITDFSGLTVSNPNYTVVGAVGSAVLGSQSLALDHVVSGSVSIATSGATTTVTQTTDRAIIDWFRFSIAAGETVNFVQPSASSVVLNRVTGNEQSVIAGALNSNGRVFILNSAGVLLTAGSSINVGALVASTLNVSDANFNAGNYLFVAAGGTGSVVAAGDIVIVDGGFLALASNNSVEQSGNVTARGGKALLASANTLNLTLNSANSGLSSYIVGNLAGTTKVGGNINLAATSGNGGLLETAGPNISVANNLSLNTGTNGTWSWTQPTVTIGSGGVTAQFVAGTLASRNFSLNAINGDITINDPVSWSASTTLGLTASNNININASLTATGASAGLAMNYGGDYNILSPATYSGVTFDSNGYPIPLLAPAGTQYASVTLSGANAGLKINGTNYALIQNVAQLDALDGHDATVLPGTTAASVTGNYALGQNIDASGTTYTDALIEKFSGTLAGLGHTVANLAINSTATVNNGAISNLGLIGQTTAGSLIRDIGVTNANIGSTGTTNGAAVNGRFIGALVGSNLATISKAYSTGSIRGDNAGGLLGQSGSANGVFTNIMDSFSTANVTGNGIGGLIGYSQYENIYRSHASGTITGGGAGLVNYASNTNVYDSYATGAVIGNASTSSMGGLIGTIPSSSAPTIIRNSFATGDVTGGASLGGLIGIISASSSNITIDNTYATGNVTSLQNIVISTTPGIGGLIGDMSVFTNSAIVITNSHATGNVGFTGSLGDAAGGLVGYISNSGGNATISSSYATGNVTGSTTGAGTGGLVGTSAATITNSYATGNVTGNNNSGGLAGSSTGAISNSYATGNVVANSTAGGLVGTNTSVASITGSYATGNVTSNGLGVTNAAANAAGGLVGANSGFIGNSYASGAVTSVAGQAGGIAGVNFNNSGNLNSTTAGVINNSYFNSEVNPGLSLTNTPTFLIAGQIVVGKVTGGGGLTSAQIKDAPFYINGTINQVLAARTAAADAAAAARAAAARQAQTQQAASGAGNVISNRAAAPTAAPNGSLATAGRAAVAAVPPADVDAIMQGVEPTQTPLPAVRTHAQHASTTSGPHKVRASSPGAHYRARIRGIDVDGQHFDLGTDGKNSAAAPKAQ